MKLFGILILSMSVVACTQNDSSKSAAGKEVVAEKPPQQTPSKAPTASTVSPKVSAPVQVPAVSTKSASVKINDVTNENQSAWSKVKVFANYADKSKNSFLTMTPDGTKLLVVDAAGNFKLLDLKKKRQSELPGFFNSHSYVRSTYSVSPDGSKLVASHPRDCNLPSLKMLDLNTLQEVKLPFRLSNCGASINQFAFSPDSSKLVVAYGQKFIDGFDLKKKTRLFATSITTGREVQHLAFTPDSSKLVVADSFPEIKLIDFKTAKEIPSNFGANYGAVSELKFAPDGSKIIVIGKSNVRILDLKTNRELMNFVGGQYTRFDSSMTQDGATLVIVKSEMPVSTVTILNLKSMKSTDRPLWPDATLASELIFMTPDGSAIFSSDTEYNLRAFNLKTFEEIKMESHSEGTIKEGLITSDNSKFVTFGWNGEITILDLQTMKRIPAPYSHPSAIDFARVTPDGTKIFTTDEAGNLVIWFKDAKEADAWN